MRAGFAESKKHRTDPASSKRATKEWHRFLGFSPREVIHNDYTMIYPDHVFSNVWKRVF